MDLESAIKHAEEVMIENSEKTKDRNASDPIAISCFECADEHRQLAEWLKELKQLREQTQWVPVSEDCPKKNGRYLCTVGTDHRNPREMYYEPKGKNNRTWASLDRSYVEDCFVIAWKPLPQPYKAESEE